jgi:hemolysin D
VIGFITRRLLRRGKAPAERAQRVSDPDFLPAVLEVTETPASPTARVTAISITAMIAFAIVWATLGRVDVVATATGTVIPAGRVKVVQSADPGIVSAILVEDGEHVEAGRVLVELDRTLLEAERRRIAEQVTEARLDAAMSGAILRELGEPGALAAFRAPVGIEPERVETRRLAALARVAEHRARVEAIEGEMKAKAEEKASNAIGIDKLAALLPLAREKDAMYEKLQTVQYANKVAALQAQEQLVQAEHDLKIFEGKTRELDAALAAMESQRVGARATFRQTLLKEQADAEDRLRQGEQSLRQAEFKVERSTLTAPVAGIVQQLAVHTVGGVVSPAQPLMVIVPDGAPVLVEAMLENKDVGFVRPGQRVEVKIETFNYTKYGLVDGSVVDISRDAVQAQATQAPPGGAAGNESDPKRGGYIMRVALDKRSVLVDGRDEPIRTGMAVIAEVRTGNRRVIEFLLSPIQSYAQEALRER